MCLLYNAECCKKPHRSVIYRPSHALGTWYAVLVVHTVGTSSTARLTRVLSPHDLSKQTYNNGFWAAPRTSTLALAVSACMSALMPTLPPHRFLSSNRLRSISSRGRRRRSNYESCAKGEFTNSIIQVD